MAKAKKEESQGLDQNQIKFITKKVHELGNYRAVCSHYNFKDEVSRFARETAYEVYNVSEEDYEEVITTTTRTKLEPKEPKTVKRKREINLNEVLDDGEA